MDSVKEAKEGERERKPDIQQRRRRQRKACARSSKKSLYSPGQCGRHMKRIKASLDRISSIEQMQAYLAGLHDEENSKLKQLQQRTKRMFRDCYKHVKVDLNDCVVCLDKIKSDDQICYNPGCLHVLHKQCMTEWLDYSKTCPLCRQVVSEPQVADAENVLIAETFAKFVTQ